MKPVVFDVRGVKFSVEVGNAVYLNSDGELSFDESNIGGLNWPKPIEIPSAKSLKRVLGGLMRGEVAKDIIPSNLPKGVVRQVKANCDSTIRNAAYRFDMKLKIKKVGKSLYNVESV